MNLSKSLDENNKTFQLILVFSVILAGHYLLMALELLDFTSSGYSLAPYFEIDNYAGKPWQLLLPVNIGDNFYRYTTTGLVLMSAIQKMWTFLVNAEVSMNLTLLTLSTLLVLTTYLTAWKATHSRTFTITVTICMAFGTQFYGLYSNSSIMIYYLFYTFIELNLLCFYLFLISTGKSVVLKSCFVISLICVALCWEMWLDYAAFMFLSLAVLYFLVYKKKLELQFSKLHYVSISSSAIFILYLAIKVNSAAGISEHFEKGKEGESVLNYLGEPESKTSVILIEDIISNLMTYNYVSVSNYLPPFLLSSNSLYYLGQKTSDYQYGYHQESQHFVYHHYIFYWYYFAGAFFALLLIIMYGTVKSIWTDSDNQFYIILFLTLLMILFGSFTHLFVKYRPYLSVPLLGYKCITSTLGVTLFLGFMAMLVRKKVTKKRFYLIASFIWITVISSGFSRPSRFLELGREVMPGSSWQQLPDPLKNPKAIYYYLFPGAVSSAQKVRQWLDAGGGKVVDKSSITVKDDGSVIYMADVNWVGRISGKNIVWKNSISGKTNIWSPINE